MKSYRADIRLAPDGHGTAITWTATMVPKFSLGGVVVLGYTRGIVRVFSRQLVRYADRLMPAP